MTDTLQPGTPLLGGAAACPLAARAQQGDRVRRIGVLMPLDENDPVTKTSLSAFTVSSMPRQRRSIRTLRASVQPKSARIVASLRGTGGTDPLTRSCTGIGTPSCTNEPALAVACNAGT
jgi:hypothetical protein